MLGIIISSVLIILLVIKLQVSDRICDEATNRIIYSDEEYSQESDKVEFDDYFTKKDESEQKSSRMDSETFSKEFDKEDYTDAKTEKDAEDLLKRIYAGGGKNK